MMRTLRTIVVALVTAAVFLSPVTGAWALAVEAEPVVTTDAAACCPHCAAEHPEEAACPSCAADRGCCSDEPCQGGPCCPCCPFPTSPTLFLTSTVVTVDEVSLSAVLTLPPVHWPSRFDEPNPPVPRV